jgi:hypothetical protein
MIYDLESLIPSRIIRAGDVDELLELAIGMIPQERQRRYNRARCDIESELVTNDRELLNVFRETGHDVRAKGVQLRRRRLVRRL